MENSLGIVSSGRQRVFLDFSLVSLHADACLAYCKQDKPSISARDFVFQVSRDTSCSCLHRGGFGHLRLIAMESRHHVPIELLGDTAA
jgi:hypothetical protein